MPGTTPMEAILEIAVDSGFNFAGATNVEPLAVFPHYEEWLSAGLHAGMRYLENPDMLPARRDPSRFFPEAVSIIFLGIRYPVNRLDPLPSSRHGRVSSYAWGLDYHAVLPPAIQTMVDRLRSLAGFDLPFKTSVDSAPVLEKPLAARAGLGWQGRNSCLIHPVFGSFFFLAGLFVPLNITGQPDPVPDRCGTCRRCVEACPTGCIRPDGTIDAGRCLSYLTIENKGAIPRDLRPLMGDWLFGCDVCQSVCPWNAKLDDSDVHPGFQSPDAQMMFPNLEKITRLTKEEFKHTYKTSPLLRAKRKGLLRNAAVVLGNSGDTGALPVLGHMLREEVEPLVRSHAAWAVGRLRAPEGRQMLSQSLRREEDPSVLEEIQIALDGAN